MSNLHPNGMKRYPDWQPTTEFEHWWVDNDEPDANFTRDEVVWKAAREHLLEQQRREMLSP